MHDEFFVISLKFSAVRDLVYHEFFSSTKVRTSSLCMFHVIKIREELLSLLMALYFALMYIETSFFMTSSVK